MVELDIAEVVLHRALQHVLDSGALPAGALRVSDRPSLPCDVLVTAPTPLSCRDALEAVRAGRTRGILCADAPDELPALLLLLGSPWSAIPRRVLDLAAQATTITSRQRAVVEAIGAGRPLLEEARSLGVSEATLKRDLRRLRTELGLPDRAAVLARARELGLSTEAGNGWGPSVQGRAWGTGGSGGRCGPPSRVRPPEPPGSR